jgi:hypothetical protein
MTNRLVAVEATERPAAAEAKTRPALPVVRIRPSAGAARVVVADSRGDSDVEPADDEVADEGADMGDEEDDGAPRPLLKLYESPRRVGGIGDGEPLEVDAGPSPRHRRSIDLASVGERLPVIPMPDIDGVPSIDATPAALQLDTEPPGAGVEDTVETARDQVRAGQCEPALRSLADVLRSSPEHPLAAEAMLLRARCHRRQGAHLRAIGEIERMARRYPTSAHGAQALVEMAEAYVDLGDVTRARDVFAQVLRRYPRSRAASLATRRVQELGRDPRAREEP